MLRYPAEHSTTAEGRVIVKVRTVPEVRGEGDSEAEAIRDASQKLRDRMLYRAIGETFPGPGVAAPGDVMVPLDGPVQVDVSPVVDPRPTDRRFPSGMVSGAHRAIFEQLANAFPAYEIWERHENFGRRLSGAVLNRATGASVTIPLARGGQARTVLLTPTELEKIRAHVASDANDDVWL